MRSGRPSTSFSPPVAAASPALIERLYMVRLLFCGLTSARRNKACYSVRSSRTLRSWVAGADSDEWSADGLVLQIMTRRSAERAKKMIQIVRMFEDGVKALVSEHNHEQLRRYTDAFVLNSGGGSLTSQRPAEGGHGRASSATQCVLGCAL